MFSAGIGTGMHDATSKKTAFFSITYWLVPVYCNAIGVRPYIFFCSSRNVMWIAITTDVIFMHLEFFL
jgi:hypothetical protein